MRFLLFLLLAFSAQAADLITATITITNAPTTNGMTLTVNGNVRTWTNAVVIPGSQILTNASIGGSATNLYSQVALNPYSGLTLTRYGTNGIQLMGTPGGSLSASVSANGWGSVTLTTNTTTAAVVVRVPYTVEAAAQQTNIVSGLVAALNSAVTTNSLFENSTSVSNLVGVTNNQIVRGIKYLTNVASEYYGNVSNATSIGGTAYRITNGLYWNAILRSPTLTNGANYGDAFSSPGSGTASEQFGTGALALGLGALALGNSAFATNTLDIAAGNGSIASGPSASAFGNNAVALEAEATALGRSATASEVSSTAIGDSATAGHQFSTAVGQAATTTAEHQIMMGTGSEHVSIPGNVAIAGNTELHWLRYPITSLANGVNAAVPVLTNSFVELSGPTGAFSVDGIANGSNGKFIILLNQTTFAMTIAHQSGSEATAANRIITMTGADRATTGNGAAMLIYSGAASRWILISLDQ